MSTIARDYDANDNIVTFVLEGRIDADALVASADEHFSEWPDSRAIWDLTGADLSEFGLQDLERISSRSSEVRGRSGDPRSAIIVDDSTKRLLVKLYDAVSTKGESAVTFQSFETIAEARTWLLSEDRGQQQNGSIAC